MSFRFPFYPVLLAGYFPIFLCSQNISRYSPQVALHPLLWVILAATLLLAISWSLFKDVHKAAFWLSANIGVFFLYGSLFSQLKGITSGSNFIMLGFWISMNMGLFVLFWKNKSFMMNWSRRLNVLGLLLLSFPLFSLSKSFYCEAFKKTQNHSFPINIIFEKSSSSQERHARPDIYHIMMDAYSRADVLKETYGIDNSGFIQALRQKGFNIGDESYSNYSVTGLSLTSTLNFNYIDSLLVDFPHTSPNWKKLESLKNNAKATQFLLSKGYQWKVIPNGWENTFPINADIIQAPQGVFSNVVFNEFQNGVLNMTPIPHLLAAGGYNHLSVQSQHRNRILFAFDYLMGAPDEPGPKYVFCHILAPHSPVVFGASGELREDIPDLNILRKTDPRLFRLAVKDEITYLNQRLLDIVDKIIQDSKGQAVILIHSDHGESMLEFSDDLNFLHQRHGVLAALYLPGGAQERQFSAGISPVNFFRVIFNRLFNTGLPLLEAKTFCSNRNNPFDLKDITDTLNALTRDNQR